MLDQRGAGHRARRRAVRPVQRRDAQAGRPDRRHLALPLHARRRAGNHPQQRRRNEPAPWTATPCSATRSSTASRRSSTPQFARQTGQTLDYDAPAVPAGRLRRRRCARFAASGARGCNVTVPFKFEAGALAPRRHAARRAGAGRQRAALRRRRLAGRQHRRRRPGARHRAQRRRGAAGRARAADRRRRRGGRRAGPAARGAARRSCRGQPHGRQGAGAGAAARARWPRSTACALSGSGLGTTAARPSTWCINGSASSLGGAAVPVPAAVLEPGALALDMMYGPAARALHGLGRDARARCRATAWACWSSRRPRPSCCGAACARHGAGAARAAPAPGRHGAAPMKSLARHGCLRAAAAVRCWRCSCTSALRIGADDRRRPAVHHLPAHRGLAAAGGAAADPAGASSGCPTPQHRAAPEARRDRQRGRRLRRPQRRRVGRDREGLGDATSAPRRGPSSAGRRPRAQAPQPAARASPRWSAARPSPSSWRRTCSCRASARVLRKAQEFVLTLMLEALLSQAAHPGDLPEQRRMGRRRVRRPGRRAALLPHRRGAPGPDAGGAAGGDAAGAQALREAPGSAYVLGRAATIAARMGAVELPERRWRAALESIDERVAQPTRSPRRRAAGGRGRHGVRRRPSARRRARSAAAARRGRAAEQRGGRGRGARLPRRCSAPTPSRPSCARCAQLALRWMQRLAEFRPHLTGAVWRGTATRLSACTWTCTATTRRRPRSRSSTWASTTTWQLGRPRRGDVHVLSVAERCAALGEPVTLHLAVLDHDDLRGALKPDARGRSWRGDAGRAAAAAAGRRRHEQQRSAPWDGGRRGRAAAAAGVGWSWWRSAARRSPPMDAPTSTCCGPALRRDREGGELAHGRALRGQPLLLNFWATWCPPCVREMPALDRFAARLRRQRRRRSSAWRSTAWSRCASSCPASGRLCRSGWPASTASSWRAAWATRAARCPSPCCFDASGKVVQRKLGETRHGRAGGLGEADSGCRSS